MKKSVTYEDMLYSYLCTNHTGKENGVKRSVLANRLGMTQRQLRRLTQSINRNPKYERLVSTSGMCYICRTRNECQIAIANTYKNAITLFRKAKAMEKKYAMNGQVKIILKPDEYKEFVETFEKEREQ